MRRFDAIFEARVEHAHFVARLRDLARVAHSRHHHAAHDQNNDPAADDRNPPEHRGIGSLLAHARGQTFVGGQDDAIEKDVGLIHQRLAAVGAEQRQALGILALALERDGLVHLADFLVDDRSQSPQHRGGLRVAVDALGQGVELAQRLRPRGVIRREVDLVAGDEVAALAGLGVAHRIAQLDRRGANVARFEHLVEIDLRPVSEPDRRHDDAEQCQEPDGEQPNRGPNDKTGADGHDWSAVPDISAPHKQIAAFGEPRLRVPVRSCDPANRARRRAARPRTGSAPTSADTRSRGWSSRSPAAYG